MNGAVALWLYGSHARGDKDALSDLDLLLVSDAPQLSFETTASRYTWAEIEAMAASGSVFLHHLRMEGRPLLESKEAAGRMRALLEGLGTYKNTKRDANAFATVISDVKEELRNGSPPSYELGVLGTVVRHASILGCYIIGEPCFGREAPIRNFVKATGLPLVIGSEFSDLYQFRLAAEGRLPRALRPTLGFTKKWIARSELVVKCIGELADDEN